MIRAGGEFRQRAASRARPRRPLDAENPRLDAARAKAPKTVTSTSGVLRLCERASRRARLTIGARQCLHSLSLLCVGHATSMNHPDLNLEFSPAPSRNRMNYRLRPVLGFTCGFGYAASRPASQSKRRSRKAVAPHQKSQAMIQASGITLADLTEKLTPSRSPSNGSDLFRIAGARL